jgi:uncharacterized protein YpmB
MKKWVTFISVFIVTLTLFISLIVLWNAGQPFSNQENIAKQIALSEKKLAQVSGAEVYSGTKSYVTVFGIDENGEDKAVFIPNGKKNQPIEEVLLKEGITEEQALKVVEDEFQVQQILHTKLGWEDSNAVWEITFLNENDKLNYVYVLFENGKWWKRILNL